MERETKMEILRAVRFGVPERVIADRLGLELGILERLGGGGGGFSRALAAARRVGAAVLATDTLTIADTAEEDPQSIAKARMRINARQWLASRMDPSRFGETRHLLLDADVTVRRTSFASFLGNRVIEVEEASPTDLILVQSKPSALVTGNRSTDAVDADRAQPIETDPALDELDPFA